MKNIVDGTTWNDYLISAVRAFRLKDLDLSEQRLDKAFAAGGDDIAYLYLLAGHIAHSRGAAKEAEKSWKKVLDIEPDNSEAWNNLGVLYRKQGDDEKALAAFQEAAERTPGKPDIPYNIGNLYKSSNRFDEAISYYNKAIEIDPEYAPAFNNLGTLYESKKERSKALEVFRRGLSADSGDASLRFNMGLVYQEEERWDDARTAFDTALKNRPGWVPGLNNLGIVLQELGKEDEAARTFRTLLDIEPENVSALNNLGVAYEHLGRTDDARQCFKQALDEEPDYIKAALNLHDSYRENQELNEALEEINKQITHHPRNPEIGVRMARTLMGLTRWEEAERSLDHVLERDLEYRDALRAKADLFLATKRPDEAEEILKRLPHDPEMVRDLAKLNISSERAETAERLLEELIVVNPDDAESRRLMADLVAGDRPEEAVRLREEAAGADPGKTGDLISLAEIYGRMGQKDQALGKLDEAVSLLGSRGEAEDLDEMNAVLGLYEKAATALESEKGDMFTERIAQLGRKLHSAMGRSGKDVLHRGQIASEEIPVDEEDALSLLDLNAMEPVIRINEEEETVFLEESSEDLEDAYTELYQPEHMSDEPGFPQGQGYPQQHLESPPPAPVSPADLTGQANQANQAGQTGQAGQAPAGPPVHIHLPAQSAFPQAPQVVYQDIRPVSHQPPPPPPSPPPVSTPEISVEDLSDEDIPEFPKEEDDDSLKLEIIESDETLTEEESPIESKPFEEESSGEAGSVEEEDDDENHFFIPDSDVLSEELPVISEPELPDADLVFAQSLMLEEDDEEIVLTEDFDEQEEIEEIEEIEPEPKPEEGNEDVPGETVEPNKMADMFKYLSDLTDETTGEGRQQLIEDGVPLKLAGIHARLSGEPKLRETAQKYDRRRRDRHNIELNEKNIKDSLNAFKDLAEAYPNHSVSESLSKKLSKIMSFVSRSKDEGGNDSN